MTVTTLPVSPAELLKQILDDRIIPNVIPAGAVVGSADDNQQNLGVVSIMDAGATKEELYVPLLWYRAQLRCIAPTLAEVDVIGRHVFDLLHNYGREVVLQPSTGSKYLVNGIYVSSAPSHHRDSDETLEDLLFATVCIHRDPVEQG